jgi:hypothetical protein
MCLKQTQRTQENSLRTFPPPSAGALCASHRGPENPLQTIKQKKREKEKHTSRTRPATLAVAPRNQTLHFRRLIYLPCTSAKNPCFRKTPVASGSNVLPLVVSITSGRKSSHGMPSDFRAPANSAYESSRRSAISIPMLLEGNDLPVYLHDRELSRSLLPGGL